jgi:TPR repeat protein
MELEVNRNQLIRLAQSGDKDAKYQLGRLAEDAGQVDEAKKWFHEAAAAGSPAAMNAIGLLAHSAGDLQRARNWYEKAANNGYSMALNNLGTISEDPKEARKWFEAGVKAGNSLAMFNLGLILLESGEEKQSLDLFLASAKLGDSNAMAQLGLTEEEAGNLEEARSWYMRAAELENSQAMYNLGVLNHDQGDISEAKKWYESALQAGNLWPLNNLGRIAEAEGDVTTANSLYIKAAENGNPVAMTNLGIFAEESENLSEAIKWYEQAAALDQPDAMYQLGKIASSTGDVDQARIWWEKAAAIGHESSIDALRFAETANMDSGTQEINIDDEFSDLNGFGNWEWIEVLEAFANDNQEELEEIKDSYPGAFEIFVSLREYGLFEIWAEWGSNLEFGRGCEETQSDFLAGLDREEEIEDESGVSYISGEDLPDWETWQRLSVREEYLPSSGDDRYAFNIEGGVCAISGKAPQLFLESDVESESKILSDVSGIDCQIHESSDDCYDNKCEASLITIGSGLGDGYYRAVAFNNRSGDIECVLTYFSYNWEHVESKLILGKGTIGTKGDGTLVGNLEDQIPIYLGQIKSDGSLNFGDREAWSEAGSGDDFKIASMVVPADEYLALAWIDALSFEPDDMRVFIVGLYRGEMKQHYLNLMDEFPVMKTFADEHLDFARNLGDY